MPMELPKLLDNNTRQRGGARTRVKGERVGATSKNLPHFQTPLHFPRIAKHIYPVSFIKSKRT